MHQQGQPEGPRQGNHDAEDRALERFQRFNPPRFLGEPNPDIAEGWLNRMMDIFAALGYAEERQVAFAVFQFEGPARDWWNLIRVRWTREQTPWTWENFTQAFNEKFLPPTVQERREEEFLRIRQGSRSVAEYETQFTKLARFAPEVVATEQHRIQHFIQGLNVELREALVPIPIATFSQALEMSQRVETAKLDVKTFRERKRPFVAGQSSKGEPSSKMSRGAGETRPAGIPPQGVAG